MNIQKRLELFHKKIKVETEELREKRNILTNKIQASLEKAGHPTCDTINQGSYIYGVGVTPLTGQEYDIDVGLVFSIDTHNHKPKEVRGWVYSAIENHTNNVEHRGACIRVYYSAGYHVDLVIYAQSSSETNKDHYQLARDDDTWNLAEPKKLKQYILDSRQNFISTKDNSGADQIQRVTRYLKRWNDLDIPEDNNPDKPSGLATLLLVIKLLPIPILNNQGTSDDLGALISIGKKISLISERIVINKPTQQYDDVYAKLDEKAMTHLKKRFSSLLEDLEKIKNLQEPDAIKLLKKHFGSDFPETEIKEESLQNISVAVAIQDMEKAIPSFKNPAKPWSA